MVEDIDKVIDGYEGDMIETMKRMVAIPSISPASGGEGESKRADFLESIIRSMGLETKRYNYNDGKGIRSNIITRYGNADRTIWLIAHIDTVAPGDLAAWSHNPFDAVVRDGRVYGRGASDNGQDVIASIYALKAIIESGIQPKYRFGLALVADEEIGSHWGMERLMNEGIFSDKDMFVVPDAGSPDGRHIEVAEKGVLWVRIKTIGKQIHASTPMMGINANRHSASFITKLDKLLHEKYRAKNSLFNPEVSTFEPTKREPNVDSVNIIPGSDVSYIDCRVLPEYKLDDILADMRSVADEEEKSEKGLKIELEVFNRDDSAQPTSGDSEIAKLMSASVREKIGVEPVLVGIGGGTVALFFRRIGLPAVAWMLDDDTAHQIDEYCSVDHLTKDAKVFARLFY